MEEVGEEGGGYVAPSLTSPKQRAGQPQQQRQGMKPFSNTKNNDNITDLTGVFDQDLFNIGGGGSNSNMLFTNAPSSFSTQLISAAAAASDTMALVKCTHTTAIVCPVAEDKLAVLTETVFYYLLRLQKLDKYWKYLFGVENYNDLQDIYCHISPVWKSNNARAVKLLQACHQQLQRSSSSSSFSYTISKKILSQLEKLAAGVYSFSDIGESSSRDLVQRKVFQSFYDFSEAFSDEAQLESTWSEEAKLCMDSFKDKFRNAISFCTNCAGVLFVDPQFPSSLGVTDPCVNRVWEDDQFCRYCMEKVKRRMNPSASKIKFKVNE